MGADNPLLPLAAVSLGLFALVAFLVFMVVKLRRAGRDSSTSSADRLSEEAFAAATIQAALASRPAPPAGPATVQSAMPVPGDGIDGALLDALPIGLLATDEAGVVRRCTALARDWLGLAGPGTGHPYRSTLARWPAIADALAAAHAGDTPPGFEVVDGTLPSGRLTVTVVRWTPRGGRGGAMAVLGPAPASAPAVATDDASGHVADAGIAEAARLASGLAHELANSLTTVHGYSHMIDRSVLTAADRTALEHITSSSEKMLTTVEAFRALVRPLPVTPTTFAPVDAVRAAIDLARQEAGQPEAAVTLTSAPTGTVHGDRVLLEEAIAAVIRNAIEATALVAGAPPVVVAVGQPAGSACVQVVVTDHGPGIPTDVRTRVFQPFLSDKPDHDGLGLARTAQVLRAHPGAAIALTHPADGGLVVTIDLPPSI
jgi:signal transduction histidine kinase